MAFDVIDGYLEDTNRKLAEHKVRHKLLREKLGKAQKEQKERYPSRLSGELIYALETGPAEINSSRFSIFRDKLSSAADIPPGIRRSQEIIGEYAFWCFEEEADHEDLSPESVRLMFSIFAQEITRSYLYDEQVQLPERKFDELVMGFGVHMFEALNRLYVSSHLIAAENDFYCSLFEETDSGRESFFRNAWALWHQALGDYAAETARIKKALHLDTLCMNALDAKLPEEYSNYVNLLEATLSPGTKEFRGQFLNHMLRRIEYAGKIEQTL